MHCIFGAIMLACAQSAAITVDGPLRSASTYTANDAWRYAAYYSPAIINAPVNYIVPGRRA